MAYLEEPLDPEPRAYVVLAHCFTCSKDLKALHTISRVLVQEGMAVLRFDFTGLGESEGDFAGTSFTSNVDDVQEAVRFMRQKYDAPALLVGHSLGGAAVLQAAAQLDGVAAVATINAPVNPEHVTQLLEESVDEIEKCGEATATIAGRSFRIKKHFLDDLEEANMQEVVGRLDAALLVLHGPLDNVVGVRNARGLFEAAKQPKSYVSLDQADHLLTDEADAAYAAHVLAAWAGKYVERQLDEVRDGREAGEQVVVRTAGGSFQTEVWASGHHLLADEPVKVGGTDTGPNPYDYLAIALGTCTTMTLQVYAERKGWPLEEAVVHMHHDKIHAEDCAHCETEEGKVDRLDRLIELHGPLGADQKARLLEIANRCPVHRTLTTDIDVQTRIVENAGDRVEEEDADEKHH